MLQHGVGNYVWANTDGREEVGCSRDKFTGREWRAERGKTIFGAGDPAELKQICSGLLRIAFGSEIEK